MRKSYAGASAVLGVAPYVGDLLAPTTLKRFEVISELGVKSLTPEREFTARKAPLRLVHVGRAVRTKGLRDLVRALARLPSDVLVHLDVAGQGEELSLCREEARTLGVDDSISFHGQVSRDSVEQLYQRADVFIFPSFREPSGSVVFEALRHGLPVITTDRGGPGYVIDKTCGITVPALTPGQLSTDLADAITYLARNPSTRIMLANGARRRIATIGLWDAKMQWLTDLYGQLIGSAYADTRQEALNYEKS
ncbi:MAG: glycosyltransferase family 4 protein [Halioglobus sp.]|nr:glycosyltransferase family 4 protein [Halioglobus sp.]